MQDVYEYRKLSMLFYKIPSSRKYHYSTILLLSLYVLRSFKLDMINSQSDVEIRIGEFRNIVSERCYARF